MAEQGNSLQEFLHDPRLSSASKKVLRRSGIIAHSLGQENVTIEDLVAALMDFAPGNIRLLRAFSSTELFDTEEKRETFRRSRGLSPLNEELPDKILMDEPTHAVILRSVEGRRKRVEPVSIYRQINFSELLQEK